MTSIERAFQQLDPLGALTGRPITIAAAIIIPAFAIVTTWYNSADIDSWPVAIAAVVAIAVTGFVLVYASNPLRAPFTLLAHSVVSGLASIAYLLNALSMWESNRYVRDDWGAIAIGLVLLSLSQYRPPKEIASTGLSLSLLVGVVTLGQAHSLVSGAEPIAYAVAAMTPVLSLSLASAAFGQLLIDGIEGWRLRARRAATAFSDENSDWIARSVQQDRVTILNQDVVPFFADVLQRGTIGADDRDRARAISDAVRAIMVAEADRSWLDIIVGQGLGRPEALVDPQRLAGAMGTDQRTAVRALIVALVGHPGLDEDDFSLSIAPRGTTSRAVLHAGIRASESAVRSEFAPYFAVMRIVFSELRVEFSDTSLTVRFSYDQR